MMDKGLPGRVQPIEQVGLTRRKVLLVLAFVLSLIFPSTGMIQRYFGLPGVCLYIVAASGLCLLACRYFYPQFVAAISDRQMLYLSAATFLLLLTVFAVFYPLANQNTGRAGSDRDDALNLATMALLRGEYPYYARTYLGNPISPLPGSLLLAVPFVLIGNSAYQNFFWLSMFLVSMSACLANRRLSLLLLWMILLLSPIVLHELVTGGDLLANGIIVMLAIYWSVSVSRRATPGSVKWVMAAVFLGMAVTTRANFVLLLPLVFAALGRNAGWRYAAKFCVVTCTTVGLLVLPYYLYDPVGFSPLHTLGEIGRFQNILPFAGILIPAVTVGIAGLLGLRNDNGNRIVLLRNCAITMGFPVVAGTMLMSIGRGRVDFTFAGFGLIFVFFSSAALWAAIWGKGD